MVIEDIRKELIEGGQMNSNSLVNPQPIFDS